MISQNISRDLIFSTSLRLCGEKALALVILLYCTGTSAWPHPTPFSYLDLFLKPEGVEANLVAHTVDLALDLGLPSPEPLLEQSFAETKRDAMVDLLESRWGLSADGTALKASFLRMEILPDRQAIRFRWRFSWSRVPGILRIQCALFPYDRQHQTFLNVYENEELTRQEIFSESRMVSDYFTGSAQGTAAVLKKFVPAGIEHILIGPDHILFLIGLLLLGGGVWRLLGIVTAFTLAHSVTLSLAALGILTPPPRLIEPVIALSIVYVGVDNLLVGQHGRDVRAWIAFFFGFVHGFGFANVLQEFGLPRQALGWSLFSFNLGVEIGQAMIVLVVALLLAAVRNRDRLLARRIVTVGSVGIILAGSFWFVQRVFM